MNIFEIDKQLLALQDENGEILDFEAFEALVMEREQKCENLAKWIKNLKALANGITEEIATLKTKLDKVEAKTKKLEEHLARCLEGHKFTTPAVTVTFRKSETAEVDDESLVPAAFIKETVTRKPDKAKIKALLKLGTAVPGCHLEEHQNINIK